MTRKKGLLTNLTRFFTLSILSENPSHGYKIMDELEKRLGKRPSPGQIYPLLKKLKKKELISQEIEKSGDRKRKVYSLTKDGREAYSRLVNRFNDVVSTILEPRLTKCAHCGCQVYEGGYQEKIEGKLLSFCCVHCANSYKRGR